MIYNDSKLQIFFFPGIDVSVCSLFRILFLFLPAFVVFKDDLILL